MGATLPILATLMSQTDKPVVLTCMQPSGQLTIGNYLGAARNWVPLQEDHECFFGIVDQHAITVPYTPAELRKNTLSCVAQYIACGLDPAHSHLFVQSHVVGHTELAWLLACLCPLGQLERMTQFKDKSRRQGELVNSGLLYYPVLMAADILLYNADRVPVGEDQRQHVELTRDLAIRFNETYSPTFRVPDLDIPKEGARIRSLQEPEKKMSKSDENQNAVLYLLDPEELIRKKVKSAVTDTGAEVKAAEDKPGVTNLLTLLSAVSGEEIPALEEKFAGQGYAPFKEAVAEAVIEHLRPIQAKYAEIIDDKTYLEGVLRDGAEAAQKRAYKMLSKCYRKAGFVERPR